MKARVVTVQIQPGKLDEATRIYRESVIPAGAEYAGCAAMILLTDSASGRGISITHWEDDELESSEASGYLQEQFGKFAGVFAAPPVRELYDLAVAERPTTDPSHVRVVTVQFKPGQMDPAVAWYRDSVLPAARQQPGFLGAMLMTDSITGKGVSSTAWASEADLLAGQASGGYLDQQLATMADYLAAPPARETYALAVRWVRAS